MRGIRPQGSDTEKMHCCPHQPWMHDRVGPRLHLKLHSHKALGNEAVVHYSPKNKWRIDHLFFEALGRP